MFKELELKLWLYEIVIHVKIIHYNTFRANIYIIPQKIKKEGFYIFYFG